MSRLIKVVFATVAGFIKVRAWESIRHLGEAPMGFKMVILASVVGVVLSATTIGAPEEA